MKKVNQSIIFLLLIIFIAASCTDGFDDANTRKDRVTSVEPEYIFGLTTVATLRELSSTNNWYLFGNYSNQWSVIGGVGPHYGYDGRGDRIWNNLYISALTPLFTIIKDEKYAENPAYNNRVAIAKIWRSYVFSQLVGLYGPIPYSSACNGQASIKFDKEEDVYRGILAELKEAADALVLTGDKYPTEAEPFLASDIKRWREFAHCIRLRTAVRLTEVPEAWAPGLAEEAKQILVEELNNAEAGLLITSNSGNFSMKFGEATDNQNPFYKEIVANPEISTTDPGNFPVIHESLSLWMSPDTYNDPCLKVYITEGSGGSRTRPLSKYLGRPSSTDVPQDYQYQQGWSSPYQSLKYADFATVGKTFSSMTANFYFFSYPELCFIRAEAKLKGYWGGAKSAEEYYYDGIDARCAKYSITGAAVTKYKDFPGIKWSTPSDTITRGSVKGASFRDYLGGFVNSYLGNENDNLKRIVVQHWLSLFSQNIDNFILLNRTEVIPFKPHFGVDQNNGYVNGRWGYMPKRLGYPANERNINRIQTQFAIDNYLFDKGNAPANQQDQITYRLIYAKDNPGLDIPERGSIAYAAYPYPLPNLAKNR